MEGRNKENIVFQKPVEERVCRVKEQSAESNTTNQVLKGFDLTIDFSNMCDTNKFSKSIVYGMVGRSTNGSLRKE